VLRKHREKNKRRIDKVIVSLLLIRHRTFVPTNVSGSKLSVGSRPKRTIDQTHASHQRIDSLTIIGAPYREERFF
jgi:hypothetical protein